MGILDKLFDALKSTSVHPVDDELEFVFVREAGSSAGNDNSDCEPDWEAEKATGTY
jgi:hypothetical protein